MSDPQRITLAPDAESVADIRSYNRAIMEATKSIEELARRLLLLDEAPRQVLLLPDWFQEDYVRHAASVEMERVMELMSACYERIRIKSIYLCNYPAKVLRRVPEASADEIRRRRDA